MTTCKTVLQEQLDKLGITYALESLSEVDIQPSLSPEDQQRLEAALQPYGISFLEEPQSIFVQQIREVVHDLVNNPEQESLQRFSDLMSKRLNRSYSHISKIFSEVTYTSIEQYIILQRIDKAKQLIAEGELTLTEIAWRLHYSSVQHLSNQFKRVTGITPTSFDRIIKERRKLQSTRTIHPPQS